MTIFQAAEKGNLKELTRLLDSGVPVNFPNSNGDFAIHYAARYGHLAVLKLLLKRGADIEAETADCYRPLHAAVTGRHIEAVKLLLLHGANIHAETYDGETALHGAASVGDPIIAKVLIEHGADINARTIRGDTPLCCALHMAPHLPTTSKIARDKAAHAEQVRRSLHRKRDPSQKDPIQVAKMLLAHGAKVNIGKPGLTPAFYAALRNQLDILEILLQRGADPDEAHGGFMNALSEACMVKDIPTIRLLLKGGANPASWIPSHGNPLISEIWRGEVDMIRAFLDAGADANGKCQRTGATPLHRAIADDSEFSQPEIVDLLLARGADPNARDKKGNSPLHVAALHGRFEILKKLLAKDANPNPRNRDGLTPLDLALRHHRDRIAKLLQQHAQSSRQCLKHIYSHRDRAMKHRFALCSDTHGKPPPIFAETDVDAVLHAGDFYHGPDILEPAGRLNALQEWIKSISIPVFAVRGNHDFLDPAGFFLRAHDLTGHVQRLSPNLLIAGLGLAYPKYSDLPTNRNLLEASTRILVEARRLTLQSSQKNDYLLLLSHYPAPAPSLPDPSQGYDAIATLLTQLETEFEIRPLAVIEGHLHNMPRAPDHLSLHSCNIPCDIPIFRPGPQGAILQINDDTWQMHYDPD